MVSPSSGVLCRSLGLPFDYLGDEAGLWPTRLQAVPLGLLWVENLI